MRPSSIIGESQVKIGALYMIEAEVRGKPPDQRCLVRQAKTRQLVNDFER